MGATTAYGRDVVRPRLPHHLVSQHSVSGVIDAPHELVVRRRGDSQRVAHRQRVRHRSTFTTYFRRSESPHGSTYHGVRWRNPLVRDTIAALLPGARSDAVSQELRDMAYRAGLRG
jgi:hypothetical protein